MNYILDGKKAIPANDVIEWAKWFETCDRHVAKTELPNRLLISTVFLGIDHAFMGGRPLLFETMVFDHSKGGGNFHDIACERYSTWEEAEEGHARIVKQMEKP